MKRFRRLFEKRTTVERSTRTVWKSPPIATCDLMILFRAIKTSRRRAQRERKIISVSHLGERSERKILRFLCRRSAIQNANKT